MSEPRRLDEISVFNHKLTFLIPHEWIEVESGDNGTYLYQVPNARTGWFRVSLITKKDVDRPEDWLREYFSKYDGAVFIKNSGNLVRRSEKDTIEDGESLHVYYWFVFGCVLPNMIREAVFSYAVLADQANANETLSEVKLLGKLVGEARFCDLACGAPKLA